MANPQLFDRVALIGLGLIGSSLARVIKSNGLASHICGCAKSEKTRARALQLNLVDNIEDKPALCVRNADLVVLCTPIGSYAKLTEEIAPNLKRGAILSDVGSVKHSVVRVVEPLMPPEAHFVPAHPVAGTEHSGPDAGFESLYSGHWCIITPTARNDVKAIKRVSALWEQAGMQVDLMDAQHHDLVLAITSHLPHLIAYNIVGTASDLEHVTQSEVFKYAAGGFRDFTRIANSDPTMWRDIFLNNREAVLEMLGRFNEDLSSLQRAIRWEDADALEKLFQRTRKIRKGILDAGQA